MSKQGKRKISVDLPKSKDLAGRPSVFERLGTKKASSKKSSEHCRQWAQNGNCAYGKSCKFASTHTLTSPSKQRAANKDSEQQRLSKDDPKSRLHSTVVVRSGRSPDGEIDNWDQNDLECADTDVLEKRRQQLQRELELQLKMDSGKDTRKEKKKPVSSSSSSRSSSSSSTSSSSSGGSSSSSSQRQGLLKTKIKKNKLKRNSSSSSDCDAPAKKKYMKGSSLKKDKSDTKKSSLKKDDRQLKKHTVKTKGGKSTLGKKSLSPGKKSGGTPPINMKSSGKGHVGSKHGKSPIRCERNRSLTPHLSKDREKERPKDRDKEHDRDRDRDRNRGRSRSHKAHSRSPRRHGSSSKDLRRKSSTERFRPSPKKFGRRDGSTDKYRKTSASRDRNRDHRDRSLERRKDKHDDKDRYDRKDRLDRGRERGKDSKRADSKRKSRGGLSRGGPDKGLAKPNKPMERLLPRPEERMAALAAISRVSELDKPSTSKDRLDSDRVHKQERSDRVKRGDRVESIDRDPGNYDMGMDRPYDHGLPMEHYERGNDRYSDDPRDEDRSPRYGRDRRYDSGYDMGGPPRGYPEDDERYDRPHRDPSWEGRPGSMERERAYMHPHKDWEGDDYRPGGDWGRERNWPMRDSPMGEWGDKDPEMDGWHHRGHPPGPHRPRVHDDYGRGMRMDVGRVDKRRPQPRPEPEILQDPVPVPQALPQNRPDMEDDKPIPDDLSEISDDPDDILNREDMLDQTNAVESPAPPPSAEDNSLKAEVSENQSAHDASGATDEKESQDMKEDKDDEDNLDFEEISDGELEEERTRAGLGDALGVDWASLVADVQRREQVAPTGGVRDRWRPERVLTRLGISVEMAGRDLVQSILTKNAENCKVDETKNKTATENGEEVQNGNAVNDNKAEESIPPPTVDSIHPVAAVQVAIENRHRYRGALFGSGCEIRRALCARRDLALRRHLCGLPPVERGGQGQITPQPALFQAARALLMQEPVA